jgi:hypothetical protein
MTTKQTSDYRLYTPRVFNTQSRQRFFRHRTDELVRHVGAPSGAQLVLIRRIVRNEWDLFRLDARFDAEGDLSVPAMRARLAMENRLRLDLSALGLKGAAPKAPNAIDYLAAKRRAASSPDEAA